MNNPVCLTIALGVLAFLVYRGGRIWLDASRRGFDLVRRARWSCVGAILPSRYWWRARIEALSPQEQTDLLARETESLGLSRADRLRCPLCNAEIPRAWALDRDGRPTAAPGPVKCPQCDFRLDACRHCARFLPGAPSNSSWTSVDLTLGRCSFYKAVQPVEEACAPQVAERLKARGYDQLRAPRPIVDSFVPLDGCTAFAPDRKRLQSSGIRWPDAHRTALLRLAIPRSISEAESSQDLPSEEDQWLL
jgi:hypothetical protein